MTLDDKDFDDNYFKNSKSASVSNRFETHLFPWLWEIISWNNSVLAVQLSLYMSSQTYILCKNLAEFTQDRFEVIKLSLEISYALQVLTVVLWP